MKKLFCLMLSLAMLLSSFALAEVPEEESAPLTREEIEMYLDTLAAAALQEGAVVDVQEDGSASVHFSGGDLFISDEMLSDTTAVLAAILDEEQEDPRGLVIGATLEEVLRAYPNDNPALSGSYFDAALYVAGSAPEMTVGYLLRNGSQPYYLRHEIYSWQPDGVTISSIGYSLDHGFVSSIIVILDEDRLTEEEALAEIQSVAEMQEISEFTPWPESAENGEALAPFEREDLALYLMGQKIADFLDLTAEDMIEVLGRADTDEWTEDSDGTFLRLLQWEGISLLLHYNALRQEPKVDSLTLNDMTLEGPRCVSVGDFLDSVIFRFRHGDTFVSDDTLTLYGDGQTAPYGTLSYSPESAEATYALGLEDGQSAVWHLTFVAGSLESMTLMLR